MVGWFAYQAWAHQLYRWDLLVIAGLIALTKMGAMLYYRLTGCEEYFHRGVAAARAGFSSMYLPENKPVWSHMNLLFPL